MADNQFPEDEGKTRRRPRGSSAATPTAAEARAAQARAGNYVNSRDLLMDRGQAEYDRAVNRNATSMPEPPGGRRTGRGSPSMPAPPSPFGAAANAAGTAAGAGARTVARGVVGRVPIVGDLANSRSAGSGSSITSNPEAQRFLAEDAARRAGPGRADADMENQMPRPRMGAEPSVITSGGAEPDAMGARPDAGALARLRSEAQNRAPRANTRSTARMSPRQLTSDELHNIQSHTLDPESGISEMRGVRGEAARNIIARRADQDRQRELEGMKRGGPVKKMAKGGVVKSSASGRSDGCAVKGKTKGRMV